MKKKLSELIHAKEQSFPLIMGIINLTDDSFFDGGKYNHIDKALFQAEKLVKEGADILDLGAESTRPGAKVIPLEIELDRLLPVLEAIGSRLEIHLSVDTYKPVVMQKSVELGAHMINDVFALRQKGALEIASQLDVPICLMHMQRQPQIMQNNPSYGDVVLEVSEFLSQRVQSALDFGCKKENLILDVGFCFGKTLDHNLKLLKHLDRFRELNLPLLVGLSQKSMLGQILGNDSEPRLIPSVVCAAFAHQKGARILRVHNVLETVQAIKTQQSLLN